MYIFFAYSTASETEENFQHKGIISYLIKQFIISLTYYAHCDWSI